MNSCDSIPDVELNINIQDSTGVTWADTEPMRIIENNWEDNVVAVVRSEHNDVENNESDFTWRNYYLLVCNESLCDQYKTY